MNPNLHGHRLFIQCDVSSLLKSTEIFKSQAVATLSPGPLSGSVAQVRTGAGTFVSSRTCQLQNPPWDI
jgi:hypothetical protein